MDTTRDLASPSSSSVSSSASSGPTTLASATGPTTATTATAAAAAALVTDDEKKCILDPALRVLKELNLELHSVSSITPISRAILMGYKPKDFEKDKRYPFDVTTADDFGRTPLRLAAEVHDMDWVDYLLAKEADPLSKDHRNWTPFHTACRDGDEDIMELMLNVGLDFEVLGQAVEANKGENPFLVACENLQHSCIISLLDTCRTSLDQVIKEYPPPPPPSTTTTSTAGGGGGQLLSEEALAFRKDISDMVCATNARKATALHLLVSRSTCSVSILQQIISDVLALSLLNPAKFINAREEGEGQTVLHLAAKRGLTDLVRHLVTICGAKVDAQDARGETSLHLACRSALLSATSAKNGTIQTLLDLKADSRLKNARGQTPADLVKELLEAVDATLSDSQITALKITLKRLENYTAASASASSSTTAGAGERSQGMKG